MASPDQITDVLFGQLDRGKLSTSDQDIAIDCIAPVSRKLNLQQVQSQIEIALLPPARAKMMQQNID